MTDEELEALRAKKQRTNEAIEAGIAEHSDSALEAQYRAAQAATKEKRVAERRARIAARKAEKAVSVKHVEISSATSAGASRDGAQLWSAAQAVSAIKRVRKDGYRPITLKPHTLKTKNAGKGPSVFDRGAWVDTFNWGEKAKTAKLDALTDWAEHTNSAPNIGILCGVETGDGFLIGIDIDCVAPELVAAINKLGAHVIRKGRDDRSGLIPVVVDTLGREVFKRGNDDAVQLLGTGKQFAALGVHPTTKRHYTWLDIETEHATEMPALANLPRIAMADIVRALSANRFHASSTSAKTSAQRERELIERLEQSDLTDYDKLFGPPELDCLYDVEDLRQRHPESLLANPGGDHSANRMSAASLLVSEWLEMPVEHLRDFYNGWPEGAGDNWDDRQAAREYDKACRKRPINGDEIFEPVEDDADERSAYLANGGTVERWDSWQEEIAKQREERLRRAERLRESDVESERQLEDDQTEGDQTRGKQPRKSDSINLLGLLAEPETYTRWVVKHFVAFNTTIVAAGLWGSGKTAVYLDIALHVAHGLPWRGRKVEKGVVVYVGLENPHDVQSRVRAWCKRNGEDVQFEESFVLYRGNCSLFDPRDKPTKGEQRIIELANETAKRLGLPVAMIVVDTVSQAILPGSDREHGSLFVRSLQRIADATGANVTALHHPTKAGDEVRGDGAFQGNTDGVVLITRDKKTGFGTIKASAQKFRVGDPRKVSFGYKLEPVVVGKDADGENIDVVVAVETADVSWSVDEESGEGDQNIPLPPDTPNDRPTAILRVIRERVELIAANTGDTFDKIVLPAGEVLKLWNVDRKRSGLPEIPDPSVCSRLLAKLVEAEELVRVGENRRSTAYRLPAETD